MVKKMRSLGEVFDWQLFRRVMSLAVPFKNPFAIAGFMAIVLAVLAPLRPYLVQITVDEHIIRFDARGVLNMTLILVGLLVAESVLRYFFIYLTSWLGQSIIKKLRLDVFRHVVGLRLTYFDRTPIGTSTTRTINDIETINDIFSQGIIIIVADLLTLLAVMIFMFVQDWQLTLITLATFPLLIVATYVFKEKVKYAFQGVRTQVARMNAFLQEHISGMSIVQIFNAEEKEMKKFKKINEDHKQANIAAIWYYSIFFPVVEILLAGSIGLMVWWGAYQALEGQVTLGVLIAFLLYIHMLFRPVRLLADKFNTLQMGLVASERVFDLLDTRARIEDTGTLKTAEIKGDIEFKNVWFAYKDENYVLKDISFSLEAGKMLALVGATGAGKSSVINILSRFYEIQKGSICIDGTDVREYDLQFLRANIGIVLQDVFLFSGSIVDNITLKNEKIPREQVVHAAKMVGAHRFIERLPGGYDFNVRERGATLSVGQRQLISFIRALVYDPRILILDEATSSIDTETELLIQEATERLVSNRTSIVIAHRLSTIQHADKIIVLDRGEIRESGTHSELLKQEGYYKKLYEMQFKKSISA